jgi:hypothetical protein
MRAVYVENLTMAGNVSDPAWKNASDYPFELAMDAYDREPEKIRKSMGNKLRKKGTVKLLWNENYLYVGVTMEDSDVVAEGKANQTHLYLMGDLVEVFLNPANETYYWEIYGTPNNLKTIFFIPVAGGCFFPVARNISLPPNQLS